MATRAVLAYDLDQIRKLFPGWKVRAYLMESLAFEYNIRTYLQRSNVEFIEQPPSKHPTADALFDNMLVIDDPLVDRFLIKSTDFRFTLQGMFKNNNNNNNNNKYPPVFWVE